jgi:hypothetical protein
MTGRSVAISIFAVYRTASLWPCGSIENVNFGIRSFASS